MNNQHTLFEKENKIQEVLNEDETNKIDSSSIQTHIFNFQFDCEEEHDVIRSNN